ncbi:hypothetical protein [Pseudomonas sp. HLS-6 TE3448]
MVIQDGVARADLDEALYRGDSSIAQKLLKVIRARLAPYEQQSAEPVIIESSPVLTITHTDGRPRELHLECHATISVTETLDIKIYRNGVLIEDTAQERSKRLQGEAELLSKHADDDLLCRLLGSLSASKRNPGNEFTHLYEILEALQTTFGKPPKLTDALAIEKAKIGKFHAVCNDPSSVSRHRGQTNGPLRTPTAEEFSHARDFGWEMILAYARWLEHRQQRQQPTG